MLINEWGKIVAKFVFTIETRFTPRKRNLTEKKSMEENSKSELRRTGADPEVAHEAEVEADHEADLDLDADLTHVTDDDLDLDQDHEVDLAADPDNLIQPEC